MAAMREIPVVNDMGDEVMSVIDLGVEDDRLFIYGKLMGSWESKMYVEPEGLVAAVQLMLSHPELLGYLKKLPSLTKAKA